MGKNQIKTACIERNDTGNDWMKFPRKIDVIFLFVEKKSNLAGRNFSWIFTKLVPTILLLTHNSNTLSSTRQVNFIFPGSEKSD